MKVELPFPWTPAAFHELTEAAKKSDALEFIWYWEPFHQPGLRALKFAAENQWTAARLESVVADLSCPGDAAGAYLTMDPSRFIATTWSEGGRSLDKFKVPGCFLPTIGQLRDSLLKTGAGWTPVLKILPEFQEVSDWLTMNGTVLKTFHSLGPWDQLEVIEWLAGVTKSSSPLHFQRVYTL